MALALGKVERQFDIGRDPVPEQRIERDVEPLAIPFGGEYELFVDRRGAGDADDRAQPIVGVYDAPLGIDLNDADRQRLGEPAQKPFARAQRFDRVHAVGDVDHLRDHELGGGIGQPVIAGRLQPHITAVAAQVARQRPLLRIRTPEHLHPIGDCQWPVVGMKQVERARSEQLGAAAPENFGRRVVDLANYRKLVAPQRAHTRPKQRGLPAGGADVAQIAHEED